MPANAGMFLVSEEDQLLPATGLVLLSSTRSFLSRFASSRLFLCDFFLGFTLSSFLFRLTFGDRRFTSGYLSLLSGPSLGSLFARLLFGSHSFLRGGFPG